MIITAVGKLRLSVSCEIPAAILLVTLALCAPALGNTPTLLGSVQRASRDGAYYLQQGDKHLYDRGGRQNGTQQASGPETVDVRWYELLIGIFGITAVGQLVLSLFQIFVTRKAADAAKRSVQLTEHLVAEFEAPFLFPVLISNTIEEALQRPINAAHGTAPNSLRVLFTIRNFGRTPALLQKATAVLYFGDIDEGRNDPLSERPLEILLGPQDSLAKPLERVFFQPIDRIALESIQEDRAKIFLRGRITFLDVLGNRFEQTFCLTWDVASDAFMPWGPHRNRRRRLISKRRKLA